MALDPQYIGQWLDTLNKAQVQGAARPHYQDLAQANRDAQVYGADIKGAEAQFAPQYYGSRSQDMENRAGLSGVDLQYAPQIKQQALQGGGLTNLMRQMKLNQMQAQMNAPAALNTSFGEMLRDRQAIANEFGSESPELANFNQWMGAELEGGVKPYTDPFAKAQQDRARMVEELGEDHPNVVEFDRYSQNKFKAGGQMTNPVGVILDPTSGDPLINVSGTKIGNARYSGGTYLNPKTSQIMGIQTPTSKTRDMKTIAGSENVKAFMNEMLELGDVIELATTAKGKSKLFLAKQLNGLFGTDFDAPSAERLLESQVLSFAEGFINSFGLNATNENVKKAESIIRPVYGESTRGYRDRVQSQLEEFAKIQQRAESRLAGHVPLGYLGGEERRGMPVDESSMEIYLGRIDPRVIEIINRSKQPESKKNMDTDSARRRFDPVSRTLK